MQSLIILARKLSLISLHYFYQLTITRKTHLLLEVLMKTFKGPKIIKGKDFQTHKISLVKYTKFFCHYLWYI